MKTATVQPLEVCHADTCLSDYWSGHHLPHVQIPVWRGMTLAEIKAAILAEMGECIQGADADFLHDWRDEHDQARADAWHRRARAAVRRMKPARKGQRRFFLDLEPQTEDDTETVFAFFVFRPLEA